MDINEQYWGESSTWVLGSNGGYKTPSTDHEIYDQYYAPDSPQPLGEPIDISPSLWGWNKDCSWATKHTITWSNGVRDEAYCRPDVSDPVMGWEYARLTSSSPSYFRGAPNFRFNYDTVGDYGEHANYSEAHAAEQIRSVCGPSLPWVTIEWSAWCCAPVVSVYKFDNTNGWMETSLTLSGEVGGHDLAWYLANGWTPYNISMGDLYGAGDGSGGSSYERTGPDIIGQGKSFVCGMGNIKMTQTMYNWYSSNAISGDMEGKYYIQPSYGNDLQIGQGPMTPWCADTLITFDNDGVDVYDCNVMCIGGHYKYNITVWQQYDYMTFLRYAHTSQVFDDVSYHWVWQETDDYGDTIDPSATSGNVNLFTKLVIDSKAEGMTDAQAMMAAILHECAFFGLKFANLEHRAKFDDITSAGTGLGLYLPLFTPEGVTTGLYKTGQDMVDDPTVDQHYVDFNPEPIPVPEEDEDIPGEPGTGGGDRSGDWTYTNGNLTVDARNYHVLDIATYYNFIRWAKGGEVPTGGGWISNLDYGGINASDWILFVKQFPVGIPEQAANASWDELSVGGKVITDNNLNPLTGRLLKYETNSCTFKLGKIAINGALFKTPCGENFLGIDQSQAFLQLPWYGDLEIDLGRYWGAEMQIESVIDFPNGTGTYYIYSGGRVFDSVNFAIGVDLPCGAMQMANYQSAMHSYEQQIRKLNAKQAVGAVSSMAMLASGNILGAVAGGLSVVKGEMFDRPEINWQMEHTKPTPGSYLPSSGFSATRQDYIPKLLVCQPYISDYDAKTYGNQVGFACFKQGKLSSFKGYTTCSNIKFNNLGATQAEKSEILRLLQGGVYIN